MRKETELKFGMGHWARRSGTDGRQRIERFTADILASRTKRAMKKAKKLRKLDARQRGTVRGRTSLKGLQDHLGALNDIQVHQKLYLSWLQERHGQSAASRRVPVDG